MLMHVRGCDREHAAVIREREAGDRRGILVKLAETLLIRPIPYVHQSVRSAGGERVEVAVKRYGVNRVYVFDSCSRGEIMTILMTALK